MSASTEAATSKRNFGDLKFTKNKRQRTGPLEVAPSSSSSSFDSQAPPYGAQPTQSRDATVTSRFFPPAPVPLSPKSQGTILVPESSPIPPNSTYRPYQPYGYQSPNVPPSSSTSSITSNWGHSRKTSSNGDVLSSSSGFATHHASVTRQNGGVGVPSTPARTEGGASLSQRLPAYIDASGSPDPLDTLSTPGSPLIQRPKKNKRRIGTIVSSDEEEEDDTLPEYSATNATQPRPRLVRGRPPSESSPPASVTPASSSTSITTASTPKAPDLSHDPAFSLWKFQHPLASLDAAHSAWRRSNGNPKVATHLLSMPIPDPQPVQSTEVVGRNAEIDAEAKAKRDEMRARAKGSAIYANRSSLASASATKPPPARTLSPSSTASSNKPTTRTRSPAPVASTSKHRRIETPSTSKGILDLSESPAPTASGSKHRRVESSSVSKGVVDLTASPVSASPVVRLGHRKRIRRIAESSEEEEESNEEEEKAPPVPRLKGYTIRALQFFNTNNSAAIQELTGCTPEQAAAIIDLRPFKSVDDINEKLGQGKKKAGPAGLSGRLFVDCESIFEGYTTVDTILEECEEIGKGLRKAMSSWSFASNPKGEGSSKVPASLNEAEDGALSLTSVHSSSPKKSKDFIATQPALLADGVQLKEYQLLGVNWLNLLYRKEHSCILADEMGLGKTVQVISFFAHLKSRYKNKGPHLIIVPSSTLENWCREFAKFAPSISVQTYYAGKEDRMHLRQNLQDTMRCKSKEGTGWEVLITTYNLAQGDDRDRKFFRKIDWDTCVFDEGHVLKNFQSQRYQALLKYNSRWRLLLTGTPLQNNLQELVSLMNFILPEQFAGAMDSPRAIFRAKGDSKVTLLAQERVSRAKKMMTPFVLRRRKDQVLKDLPKKTVRIEWCDMTDLQMSIYKDALQRSRKTICDVEGEPDSTRSSAEPPAKKNPKKARATTKPKEKKQYLENSTNVLMELRKAASHPMLFRTRFTDEVLTGMTNQLLKEPDFKKRDAQFQFVKEDMEVMTDSELQHFCGMYKSIKKFKQDEDCYIDAGKVQTLLKLLKGYIKAGRKVLIFSQFTQILDILQVVLKQKDLKFLVLTGATAVDARQSLVDEFTEDETIPVFLLSTKAGGLGITLTAASVVIMFDQDFNPHNDKQAQDRAYRIGQKRDVEVVKLISKGTIEEDMLRLGETKLALDEAVAGDDTDGGGGEQEKEKEMKMSLLTTLRNQFEKEQMEEKSKVGIQKKRKADDPP